MPLLQAIFLRKIMLFLIFMPLSVSAMALDFSEAQQRANQGDAIAQA